MKARSILFSGAMVRAILDGVKTQTRRIVKPPSKIVPEWPFPITPCPYGQAGDRLWVRETWWQDRRDQLVAVMDVDGYTIDKHQASNATGCHVGDMAGLRANQFWRKRPSIHMPRWASRITLEIVAIRVERLQDISEADAIAEGIEPMFLGETPDMKRLGARVQFKELWERINGPGSWAANPWVWVIEFRRIPHG
ncbi:MAG: hypothetical protein BroJett021_34190 [Chloroflexota bacterium]|nr:MAG: hypothetical protein BroJett021_34190 [Chloroflexota bacterium]